MRRSLKKLHDPENRKRKKFVVIDVEARDWVKFLVGGIYDGGTVSLHYSIGTLLDDLFSNYGGCDVFAHFGGIYDFLFVLSHAYFDDDRVEISPIVPRGSGILTFTLDREGQKLFFHDSAALFPFSLERLTKSFGVAHIKKKLDVSNLKKVTLELIEYLEFDLKGFWESIDQFYEWPLIKTCGGSYTLAGQALRVLRTTLKKDVYALSVEMDRNIRPGYLGGRTEIFRPYYAGKSPLYCYDVNSLYPTVMHAEKYPNGFDCEETKYFSKRMGFYHCDVEVSDDMYLPPLGVLAKVGKSSKYVFPRGKFKGIFSIPEINYARELGVKIKTKRGFLFGSSGHLFRKFVDTLYPMKQNAKDGVTQTIAKLLLNSCYGRFGLATEKENLVFDEGQDDFYPERELRVGGKTVELGTIPVDLDTFSNVAIAAYVTSYARIYMHRLMLNCQDSLYYTDTDSIFTTKKLPTGTDLGELKLEYSVTEACFLLPKAYAMRGAKSDSGEVPSEFVKIKGFDKKKIQHFTVDDFYDRLEGEMRVLSIEQAPKVATLKTAVNQGFILGLTKATTRTLRATYDKREIFREDKVVSSPWNSRPIEVGH